MSRKLLSLLLTLALVAIPLLITGLGCAGETPRVLLVYSYDPEYAWVTEEDRGVTEIFQGKGFDIQKVYLDTKRQTSAAWFEQVSAATIATIDKFKPDLLMVFDDNACELVGKRYAASDMPVVFVGVNADPAIYNFPSANVTGVIERYDVAGALNLLKQIDPDIAKVAVLTDDSATSEGIIADIQASNPSLEMTYHKTNDFADWQSYLKEAQTNVDAIGLFQYHTLLDNTSGASLSPDEVLSWTLENNRLPEFTFFDFAVTDGVLCGRITSGYEQGKAGANIAVRIIDGEKPGNIPVAKPIHGITMVNQDRAVTLGITIPAAALQGAVVVP
jgi:ABC-type uncharacterized transport system substrate-binding protein